LENTTYHYAITAFRTGQPSLEGPYSADLELSTEALVLEADIKDLSANPGDQVLLPIEIDDLMEQEIFSMQIRLTYNPDVIRAIDVSKEGTSTESWNLVQKTIEEKGEIYFELTGSDTITLPGLLLNILFETVGEANDTTHIHFLEFSLNGGYPTVRIQDIDFKVNDVTSTGPYQLDEPKHPELKQNYPNPFNSTTRITYTIPKALAGEQVFLSIYDINMVRIRILVNSMHSSGTYTVVWDGCDHKGNRLPEGLYLYQLETDAYRDIKKIMIFR
jgi:hypothetical protein